jgi:quercetin 2,3-dioxygenase
MPAVTSDTLALPRIPDPGPDAAERPVRSVTTAPSGLEGEGFPVRRAFAGVDLATLDPFVHMDQMGEVDYAPGEPKAPPGTPIAASRPSPTSSTGSSSTRTPTAAAASSPMATRSG